MSEMFIGPGPGCYECGGTYGQHRKNCGIDKRERAARARQAEENAISKVELLRRIERLEKLLVNKPSSSGSQRSSRQKKKG